MGSPLPPVSQYQSRTSGNCARSSFTGTCSGSGSQSVWAAEYRIARVPATSALVGRGAASSAPELAASFRRFLRVIDGFTQSSLSCSLIKSISWWNGFVTDTPVDVFASNADLFDRAGDGDDADCADSEAAVDVAGGVANLIGPPGLRHARIDIPDMSRKRRPSEEIGHALRPRQASLQRDASARACVERNDSSAIPAMRRAVFLHSSAGSTVQTLNAQLCVPKVTVGSIRCRSNS
jgi:hypothetical protein